jgi:hypothetical protein
MSTKNLTEHTCDLCGVIATHHTDEPLLGWVSISVSDRFEDHAWHERDVCKRCMEALTTAQRKERPCLEKFGKQLQSMPVMGSL